MLSKEISYCDPEIRILKILNPRPQSCLLYNIGQNTDHKRPETRLKADKSCLIWYADLSSAWTNRGIMYIRTNGLQYYILAPILLSD